MSANQTTPTNLGQCNILLYLYVYVNVVYSQSRTQQNQNYVVYRMYDTRAIFEKVLAILDFILYVSLFLVDPL
jgi:hypothetical protein